MEPRALRRSSTPTHRGRSPLPVKLLVARQPVHPRAAGDPVMAADFERLQGARLGPHGARIGRQVAEQAPGVRASPQQPADFPLNAVRSRPSAWFGDPVMTDFPYPPPPRPTLDDLDPESATTDALIEMVRQHREGEDYPTPEQLLAGLPTVLRALCDHLLTGEATALDVAYRLASIIEAIEGSRTPAKPPQPLH